MFSSQGTKMYCHFCLKLTFYQSLKLPPQHTSIENYFENHATDLLSNSYLGRNARQGNELLRLKVIFSVKLSPCSNPSVQNMHPYVHIPKYALWYV